MVEIQVQMHKRNRVKIPDKTVAVFSSKGCAEKGFLSHWKISGRRTYPLIFSSYQSEYLPVFYSFPNGCCLFSTELWKTDEETVESSIFQRHFEGCFALLFCQHKTSFGKFRTVSFFIEIPIQNGEATIIFQKEKRKRYGTKNKNMAQ